MFHLNIASLSLHLDDLKVLLRLLDYPFDVIAVSETKIKEGFDPITNIYIDGYNFVHTPTKTDFGGVGLFIKNK
jgi:exonuclease III